MIALAVIQAMLSKIWKKFAISALGLDVDKRKTEWLTSINFSAVRCHFHGNWRAELSNIPGNSSALFAPGCPSSGYVDCFDRRQTRDALFREIEELAK